MGIRPSLSLSPYTTLLTPSVACITLVYSPQFSPSLASSLSSLSIPSFLPLSPLPPSLSPPSLSPPSLPLYPLFLPLSSLSITPLYLPPSLSPLPSTPPSPIYFSLSQLVDSSCYGSAIDAAGMLINKTTKSSTNGSGSATFLSTIKVTAILVGEIKIKHLGCS